MKYRVFQTRGERAWFALHCLPRDDRGQPPAVRSLERTHGLSNADLGRLIWDFYKRPSYDKMQSFAAALGTTPEWLEREEGPGPRSSWPVPPRPPPPAGMVKRTKSGKLKKATEG